MNARDQRKLVRAGFTILRPESHYNTFRIKVKRRGSFEWRTLEDHFGSKAVMMRRISELLKDDHTVQD